MSEKNINSRVLLGKLWAYVRPYRWILAFSLLALIAATGAELLMPIVVQRTVDQAIIPHYLKLDQADAALTNSKIASLQTGTGIYFSKDVINNQKHGPLGLTNNVDTNRNYLVLAVTPTKTAALTGKDLQYEVSLDGKFYIFEVEYFNTLDKSLKKTLRSEHIAIIIRNTWIFAALLVLTLVFTFFQIYLMSVTGQNVMKDLRMKLFDHMMNQSLAHLDEFPAGKLVNRVTNDVETINELFTNVLTALVKDFILMAGVIGFLFILNPRLAWIILATLPPIVFLTLYFRGKSLTAYRGIREWTSRINAFLSEYISGISVVQLFNRQEKAAREFREGDQELFRMNMKEVMVFAVFRPLIDLLSSVTIAVTIFAGAVMFNWHLLTLGVLIAAINLIQKFYQPVQDISEKFTIVQSAMAGSERIFEFLDVDRPIPDQGSGHLPVNVAGEIEFKKVCFEYKPGEPVLRDLSFKVKAGEMVAIVGYTGAGKTTIINLLTRMWDIQSGQILLDGRDITTIPLDELRRTVIPVLQDVFLFSGSIADNIRLGTAITDRKVEESARFVQAHDFIQAMPGGYQAELQERGANLSTGQRQLLSFARVIAHDPAVIVLDEATGNIDTETEKLIEKALTRMFEGRTSLVIAHRLSTIRHADRILVLSEGRLAEEGNHDALIRKKGLYYNLVKLQYQEE